MSRYGSATTSRLFSVSGTFGDAQIVATPSRVLIDLQTRNYNSNGVLYKQHALANMPLDTAVRLRELLGAAIAAATDAAPVCSLIPGIDGDIQVVLSRSGQTVIDVQSVHFDVAGQVRHDHSTIRLTYDAVCELRALLNLIAESMESRQPEMWSDATFSRTVHTQRKRRAMA